MANNLNSVKTEARYHHGALREALLLAAEELIAERGAEGFSLRETARRAGVSPSAPAHHFGDARGLLTALAGRAFALFADALEAADRGAGGARSARVKAQGLAYVRFALAHPGLFELMWRRDMIDPGDEDYRGESRRAFGMLQSAIEGRAARPVARDLTAPPDPATMASWSIVHGYAMLALGGAMGRDDKAHARALALLPRVLDHLELQRRR